MTNDTATAARQFLRDHADNIAGADDAGCTVYADRARALRATADRGTDAAAISAARRAGFRR